MDLPKPPFKSRSIRSIANIAISLKRLVTTGMPERLRISASTKSSLALFTAKSSWVSLVVARIHLLSTL